MLRRLFVGLLKSTLVGVGVGVALRSGAGLERGGVLLGYLVAMGSASTAGILGGKAPWRRDDGVEVVLKALGGVGIGALLYFLASKYAAAPLPTFLPGFPEGAKWTEIPLLVAIAAAVLYGTLIELDDGGSSASTTKPPSRRPQGPGDIDDADIVRR